MRLHADYKMGHFLCLYRLRLDGKLHYRVIYCTDGNALAYFFLLFFVLFLNECWDTLERNN